MKREHLSAYGCAFTNRQKTRKCVASLDEIPLQYEGKLFSNRYLDLCPYMKYFDLNEAFS